MDSSSKSSMSSAEISRRTAEWEIEKPIYERNIRLDELKRSLERLTQTITDIADHGGDKINPETFAVLENMLVKATELLSVL